MVVACVIILEWGLSSLKHTNRTPSEGALSYGVGLAVVARSGMSRAVAQLGINLLGGSCPTGDEPKGSRRRMLILSIRVGNPSPDMQS